MKFIVHKRKYIDYTREFLPAFLRPRYDSIVDWLKYVVYQRWYKTKFLGFFHLLSYSIKSRSKILATAKEKRLLGVDDLKVTNVSIGGMLEFQIRLLAEAHLRKIDKIDIALIYDPESPSNHWKYTSWTNKDNFHYHLAEIFPLLNVSPKLGSVFIFNSKNSFELFLHQNRSQYVTCPSIFNYANNLSFARGNYGLLRDFYIKEKFLPELELPEAITLWVKAFMKKYAKDKYVIAVNLRSNPFFAQFRNAVIDTWKSFFEYCLKKHDNVFFVVIGRKNEIVEEFRKLSNIIFEADYNVNVQHTLGFIKHSLFYMGIASGPASFAVFSKNISYVIVSFHAPDINYNYNWLKPGSFFPWQNKRLQKLIWERETPELLIKEFEDLFNKVDKEKWADNLRLNNIDESILEWPYLVKKNNNG